MSSIGKNFPLSQLNPGAIALDPGQVLAEAQGAQSPQFANILKSLESKTESGNPLELEQAAKAATQFEALLLQQMLQAMWSTIPKDGAISPSREEETYREMLHQGLANDIAEGQGIGIKPVILKELEARVRKV